MGWIRLKLWVHRGGEGGQDVEMDLSIRLDDVRRIEHYTDGSGDVGVTLAPGVEATARGDDAGALLAALGIPPAPP